MRTSLSIVYLLPALTAIAVEAPAGTAKPMVSLKNGKVRGEYETVKGTEKKVKRYLGIPFARPPVGPLRLAPPQGAEPWKGERDGTHQPPMCIQDLDKALKESLIQYIEYTPPAVSEDCLYLNVYTPADAVKGDKLPTLSPQAKGLFQRAIFQSGVALIGTYTTSDPLSEAKMVTILIDCDRNTTEEMVQCLRGKREEEFVDATKKMKVYMQGVVDGVFLPDMPEKLLKRKEVLEVPVMMGVTNHEFGWLMTQTFAPPGWQKGMNRESVLAVIDLVNPPGASSANPLIADEYLKDAKTPEDIRDGFTEILGDILMTLPVVKVAGYHRDAGVAVYVYEFVHRPEMHKLTRPSFVKADHTDDIGYMFGSCFWNGHIKVIGNITEEEKKLSKTMMAYWANFAHTGSPNGPGLVPWPQYDKQKQEYMELDLKQTVRQELKKDRVHFFTVTLPQRLESLATAAAGAGN